MKFKVGQIVAAAVIVGSLALIAFKATSEESSVTFYTPAEVYEAPQKFGKKPFRVSGLVLGGTKIWDAKARNLKFRMTDLKGHDFYVNYNGIPPDLFKEGQGVVVEGRLANTDLKADNTLNATLLMVKHSEVYDETKDHSEMREAKLINSITKGEKTSLQPSE